MAKGLDATNVYAFWVPLSFELALEKVRSPMRRDPRRN